MPPGLNIWVNDQAARAEGHAANQQRQADPDRLRQAQGAKVNIKRNVAPNTGQQRHENPRKEILQQSQKKQRGILDASEYEGSTVTSMSYPQVLDSQVNAYGRPIGHPSAPGNAHVGNEVEKDIQYEEESDEEEVEEQDEEDPVRLVVHAARAAHPAQRRPSLEESELGADPFAPNKAGDSYPPTTSGRAEHDEDEYEEHQQLFPRKDLSRHAAPAFPQRGQQVFGIEASTQQLVSRQPPLPQDRQIAPPAPHQSCHLRQQIATSLAPTTQNYMSEQRKLAYRPQTPPMTSATQHKQPVYQQPIASHVQSGRLVTCYQTGHIRGPSNIGGSMKAGSQATIVQAPPPRGHQQGQLNLFETPLDYTPEALTKKTYEELHKQSFDHYPGEQPSILSEDDEARSINERLGLVQKMDSESKQQFIASLSLGEWEDAGDWFLERFSMIITKMKDARKERRKLAKSFEEEIYKRHEGVQGKKRDIEEALSEMSKSGAVVLKAGTPKRARV
jgi:hypothetical protein